MRDWYKLLRYIIAGGTATLVDLVLLYVFTDRFHLWYLLSAILAFAIAIVVSFLLQKFWTFQDHALAGVHVQAFRYLLAGLFSLGLNAALMYVFVDLVHIYYIISQILGAGIVAFVN